MANLEKNMARKNIIFTKKTSQAIEFELNALNAKGHLDEQSMQKVLKTVHAIENQPLAYWEKDIPEPES